MHKTKYSCKSFIVIVIIKLYLRATLYLLKNLRIVIKKCRGGRGSADGMDAWWTHLWLGYFANMPQKCFFQDK